MICCCVAGRSIGLETGSSELAAELVRLTHALAADAPGGPPDWVYAIEPANDGAFRIERGGRAVALVQRRADVLAAVLSDWAVLLVQQRDVLLLHAAALARNGRALLVAGHSGHGKSTLAAALVKAGLLYLSDELAPLSLSTLEVTPCAMPLKLRQSALTLLPVLSPQIELHAEPAMARQERVFFGIPAAAACAPQQPFAVAAVVLPSLQPGQTTTLHRLWPGPAAGRLLQFVLNWQALRAAAFHTAADLAEAVPCFELVLSDVHDAVPLLTELV